MVFDGKVCPHLTFTPHTDNSSAARISPHCFLCLSVFGIISADLIGMLCALALCWMNAIFTSSCQYNVLLLCVMNSVTACNCSCAYE